MKMRDLMPCNHHPVKVMFLGEAERDSFAHHCQSHHVSPRRERSGHRDPHNGEDHGRQDQDALHNVNPQAEARIKPVCPGHFLLCSRTLLLMPRYSCENGLDYAVLVENDVYEKLM